MTIQKQLLLSNSKKCYIEKTDSIQEYGNIRKKYTKMLGFYQSNVGTQHFIEPDNINIEALFSTEDKGVKYGLFRGIIHLCHP
jgi:hypothetical protein